MSLFDEFLDLALAKTVMGGMLPASVESDRRRRMEASGRPESYNLTPMGTPEGGPRGNTLSPLQLTTGPGGAESMGAIQDLPAAHHPLQPLMDGLCDPADVVTTARHKAHKVVGGPFLAQSGDTVQGLLQVELVFRFKGSNMRLQQIGQHHPNIVSRVQEYLCGEGFHVRCPKISDHILWKSLLERLRFDWIRDNKTRIFTELSKQWKKLNTPFEQFCHFYFFRTARPAHDCKGMLTHSQKPIMVAALTGDVDAVVQLADLGFFVPPDYYWQLLSFMVAGAIGAGHIDGATLFAMRQVLALLHERQEEKVRTGAMQAAFNPISPSNAGNSAPSSQQLEIGTAPLPSTAKGVWGSKKASDQARKTSTTTKANNNSNHTSAPVTPQQQPIKDNTTTTTASSTRPPITDKKTPSKKAATNKSTPTTPSIAPKVDEPVTTTAASGSAALPLPRATGPRDPTNPWGRK
eukprot:TRINITY_DN3452_c0_g1_i5.p1 TRINITY_DN3452_c0_g1~~TRINITY_DN3452_c0_g1_i5.p1  ORF type:complete len:463 (-),score=133.23 TRINITY_DN3452_c0_g1_i5:456-1844(-)